MIYQYSHRLGSFAPQRFDPDAAAYIAAVEAADTQSLEAGVKAAYNTFIIGLKDDGIWDQIVGACILAGARTLAGALVPLKGTAPTNVSNNFVSGDYNRKNGLAGNGSTKYLDSGIATSVIPRNDNHGVVEIHTGGSLTHAVFNILPNNFSIYRTSTGHGLRNYNGSDTFTATVSTGFIGMTRTASNLAYGRAAGTALTDSTQGSNLPPTGNIPIFAALNTSTGIISAYSTTRLRFYSFGTNLGAGQTGLTNFESRINTLITDLAAAIP